MTRWEYCLSSASNIYHPFHWDIQIPSASYFECTVHCFLTCVFTGCLKVFLLCSYSRVPVCCPASLPHSLPHILPSLWGPSALFHRHEVSFWVCLLEAPWPPLGWSHHLCFGLSSWSDVSKMSHMKLWLWILAPDGTPSCLSDNCMWNLKTVLTLDKTHPISHHAWSETMSPCSFDAVVNSLIYLHPSLGIFLLWGIPLFSPPTLRYSIQIYF